MHTIWFRCVPAAICAVMLMYISPSAAQKTRPLFAVVDYMKVDEGMHDAYLTAEQTIWKPMQEERVRRGKIVGWYLFSINFTGANDEYNYATVNLYTHLDSLETPWPGDIPQEVHPKMEMGEIMETLETRTAVRSELLYQVINAPPNIPLAPAPYVQVNFMKVDPDKSGEYETLEKETWLPIHTELIKDGITSASAVWGIVFPRGASREYQYVSMDFVPRFADSFEIDFERGFNKAYPEQAMDELVSKTRNVRTIVRTELWELIDYVIN